MNSFLTSGLYFQEIFHIRNELWKTGELQARLLTQSKAKMVGRRKSSSDVKLSSSSVSNSEAVPPGQSTTTNTKSSSSSSSASVRAKTRKVRNGFIAKRKYFDKGVQTVDLDLLTSEEPTISYWKELAENRRQALEEALRENEALHSRISDLEKDNNMLEEMVQEAKEIAEVVSKLPNFSSADESGFDGEFETDNDTSINDQVS